MVVYIHSFFRIFANPKYIKIDALHHSKTQYIVHSLYLSKDHIKKSQSNPVFTAMRTSHEEGVEANDAYYMRKCVELAKRAIGCTSPNPMCCVIVKDGEVVGQGFHLKAGQPHDEVITMSSFNFSSNVIP